MLWQILLCSLCTLWCFRRWRWLRLTSNIPTLPGTWPIIGVAQKGLGTTESLWDFFKTWSHKDNSFDGIVKTWSGPVSVVIITDAQYGLSVMNSYLQRHHFYSFGVPFLGQGLLTATVSTWKRHRKLLSPAFTQHVIDGFLPIFNKQSELLVEAMKEQTGKGKFDPSQVISEIALVTICQTAFGQTLGSKNTLSQEYFKAIDKLLDVLTKRMKSIWLHPSFIYDRTFTKKEQTEAIDIAKGMSVKVIALEKSTNKIENLYDKSQNNTYTSCPTKSFVNLLMEFNEKGQLSDSETREEIDTIIASGYDTTSTTLQIVLVILGSYPEVQDRLYHEIKSVIPESSRDIPKEAFSKLLYLEAVIKETLRLYPTVPLIGRTADKTLKFDDFTIPDGTGIAVFIYGVNRNEKYWGCDANEFKPERWLHPSTLPNHPAAFASFSLGRRNCVGKSYAMMSLKTSVAHILRQYRVTADDTKLKLKYEFILKPVSGHFISIEQR